MHVLCSQSESRNSRKDRRRNSRKDIGGGEKELENEKRKELGPGGA